MRGEKIILKKIIVFILAAFLLPITFTAFSQKLTVSPPYPDVWGYDLSSLPAVKCGASDVQGYLMDDGEVWFVVTHSYKESFKKDLSEHHSDYKYLLIKFFTGEKIQLSEKQRKKVSDIIDKHCVSHPDYNHDHFFKDGSKVRFSPFHTAAKCFFPDFYNQYFLITDPKGEESKYVVLAGSPQVKIISTPGFTDAPSGPFFYQKLNILNLVIPLKDDTFIVFESGGNLILRFDKQFKTQFKPITSLQVGNNHYINRNFFVIDYSLIDDLEKKCSEEPPFLYQGMHDALLAHFYQQYGQ